MLLLGLAVDVSAQTVIKVLRFDKSTGLIDHGEDADIHVGEIFEVNRYDGDFVYWVGRVEVFTVRPKIAGIKLLAKAENAVIQKGDMLELQRSEYDPMQEKLDAKRTTIPGAESAKVRGQSTIEKKSNPVETNLSGRLILFNLMTGAVYSLPGRSRAMGLSMTLQVIDRQNRITEIDMSRAYTNGLALQTGFTLPFSNKLSLDLNYAYLALRTRNATESNLLRFGLKSTASLAQINACVNYCFAPHWQAGLGTGFFLPQVRIKGGRQDVTLSERQWGWMLSISHLLELGQSFWLKSTLAHNVFLDNGPAIHFFTLQVGPSFAIRR